jgi:glycosyltransferase involved in cell wall biosynthesis
MRIGIDVRYLSHGLVGGVHTYIAHFVPALIELAGDHQVFLYADTKRKFELVSLPGNVTLRLLPYRNALSSFYHDLFMRRELERDKLDVIHFPANYGFGPRRAKTVITLHDAINILPLREIIRGHPKDLRTMVMMTYLHYCSTAALRQASLLLTASEHAKREIARHSNFNPQKIIPMPHAPTADFRRIEDKKTLADVRIRHKIPQSFVLADALKNPAVLARAWQLLPESIRASRKIVFFSRRPDVFPVVHETVERGEAQLLIRPSREDLIALFSMAEAFVFPSWIEGFGLPVLEAMRCGAPVIASDRGSIPEVAGEAALLCDAEDAETLAKHIEFVLSDSGEARRLRQLGFARAAQFSWQNTAQKILESYQHVVMR